MNYFEYYNIPSYKFGGKGFLANMANYGRKLKEFLNTLKASKVAKAKPAKKSVADEIIANDEISNLPAAVGTKTTDPEWIKTYHATLENEAGLKALSPEEAKDVLKYFIPGYTNYQIIPGGRVDKYAKFMEGRFGEKLPEDLRIFAEEQGAFSGGYRPNFHLATLDPRTVFHNPSSIAVHEITSHGTDPNSYQKLLIKDAHNKIPFEKYDTQWKELRDYLDKIREKYSYTTKHKNSLDDIEVRATGNEARERILNAKYKDKPYPTTKEELEAVIDDNFTNDDLIKWFFGSESTYAKDYKALYNKMNPAEKQKFVEMLRDNFKYTPSVAILLGLGLGVGTMNNNE